ncbi:MAG: GTP-binding protein, partial [Xanthomonadaceae bacterium]|nr:GTP-binding protein [Xanthomonadaceae bacterium]
MLPIFALVGRPNVGKSTIFNILTRTRDALVADQPGLTRDRQYGHGVVGDNPYMILDTGGLSGDENRMDQLIESQVWKAVDEADVILFVVDGREGLTAFDEDIANRLRRSDKPCIVVVNKAEGQDPELIMSD